MRLALGAALAAVLTAALTSCLTAAEGEITRRISNELELNYNNVSGAGASQSTLSEKFNIIENIQLNQGVDSEKNSYWLNLGAEGQTTARWTFVRFRSPICSSRWGAGRSAGRLATPSSTSRSTR